MGNLSDRTIAVTELLHPEEIEASISAYLSEHPLATDTLEGICEWWLMRHQVRVSLDNLFKTLQGLTERGVLETLKTGDVVTYRLSRRP